MLSKLVPALISRLARPALSLALLLPGGILAVHSAAQSAATMTPASRPFSPGLAVGDTLYVSGHLGVTPTANGPAVTDTAKEAHDVLASVEKTLQAAGMSMDDLVYVEVYCTDLKLYEAFNHAYADAFHIKPLPARDFIGVKDLLFGAHFEVMGIAVRHAAEKKKQGLAVGY